MHPLRYNLFHQIHQGLRALLYHASLTVQQTDFTNASATAELKKLLEELLFLFDGHAHTEDNLVFTMIQEQAPELVAGFEAQHEEDAQLGIALHNAIAQLGIAVTADEKIIAGQSIQKALNAFTAFNLTHMAAEEGIVKETIWLYYSDEELHRKTAEIVAGLDPAKNARYSFWMLKGLGTHEIIEWFRELQANAPPFVFQQMAQLAKEALPKKDFETVGAAFNWLTV